MDEEPSSSLSADDGRSIKSSESVSISSSTCCRRQRAVSYTDEELIQESTHQFQSTQTNSNYNRKVSFLDEISQSIITTISYRPTTTHDDKHTLYYTKEDYEMFIYDDYTPNGRKRRKRRCLVGKIYCVMKEGVIIVYI